jgi:hypothetical protein
VVVARIEFGHDLSGWYHARVGLVKHGQKENEIRDRHIPEGTRPVFEQPPQVGQWAAWLAMQQPRYPAVPVLNPVSVHCDLHIQDAKLTIFWKASFIRKSNVRSHSAFSEQKLKLGLLVSDQTARVSEMYDSDAQHRTLYPKIRSSSRKT